MPSTANSSESCCDAPCNSDGLVNRGTDWPLTFLWFAFALIFFRAQTFADAFTITLGLLTLDSAASEVVNPLYALWFVPLAVAHWLAWRFKPSELAD